MVNAANEWTDVRHTLKIEKRWLDAVVDGRKRAEVRRADRAFGVGDELLLYTTDLAEGELVRVTHILRLDEIPGLTCSDSYVSLSIEPLEHLTGTALEIAMASGDPARD